MKYTLQKDYFYKTGLINKGFESTAIHMLPNGDLTIYAGFKFDGASFVPDGRKDPQTGLPATYYPSLVHDVLYIYYNELGIPRKEIEALFYKMLKEAGFKLARLYWLGTTVFGGLFLRLNGR